MIIHNIIYIYNFNGFQQIEKKKVIRISVNLLMYTFHYQQFFFNMSNFHKFKNLIFHNLNSNSNKTRYFYFKLTSRNNDVRYL